MTRTTNSEGTNIPLVRDYTGNFIYEDGVLTMILLDNGYYDNLKNSYYFYVRDHLGNNRVVMNLSGDVVQSNEYYPFGGIMASSTESGKQPYKYGNKELDTQDGLNLYDFSARLQDPMIPTFTSIDPLAEKYYSISPYAYVGNNPLKYIDPTGMDWWSTNNQDEIERILALLKSGKKVDTESLGDQWTRVTDQELADGMGVFDDVSNGFTIDGVSYEDYQGYGVKNGMSLYDIGSKTSTSLGALGAGLESSAATFRLTKGAAYGYPYILSPKLYRSGWTGGSRAWITTYKLSNLGKALGVSSALFTIGLSRYGMEQYKIDPTFPNAVHPAKGSLDIGMSVYSLAFPYVGAGYFVIDATIGWSPIIRASTETHQFHNKMSRKYWYYPNYSTVTQY